MYSKLTGIGYASKLALVKNITCHNPGAVRSESATISATEINWIGALNPLEGSTPIVESGLILISYRSKNSSKTNFFDEFVGKTHSDDVLLSYYFRHEEIDMVIVPYEPQIDRFDTYKKWDVNKGVTSFPVLKHAHGPMNVGTQNPEMLKVEQRFFIPQEFHKKVKGW